MARKAQREAVLAELVRSSGPLSAVEILHRAESDLPRRTLRRWLSEWVEQGVITRSGVGRATRYQSVAAAGEEATLASSPMAFLRGLDSDLKRELLAQVRDLWTHTSTALEGNTLSLGDTHFVLQEGLTISGKPIKDHQEVVGHARAIDLLYKGLDQPLTEGIVFDLHNAVQTEQVTDIYKPNGAWKVEPNGTHMVTAEGRQVFIDYAMPSSVPVLMAEIIEFMNAIDIDDVYPKGTWSAVTAQEYYSKIHMGIAHVHPFWDGNGRIARLMANIPLLKAGLPPLTIPGEQRRNYIQLLADYQLAVGQLDESTGVWPDESLLSEFNSFCESSYCAIRELVAGAYEVQGRRV
ncbi:MAG: Fic family protein [Desulfobulbaceae bacterium]|nr:Fic family protein [Desulfobulbaceae bacterium]